jgi:hypothetical protein
MEWEQVSELRPLTAYYSSPGDNIVIDKHGGMISTENSWFFHHNSLAILLAVSGSKQEE